MRELKQKHCYNEEISRQLFNIEDYLVKTMRDPNFGQTLFYQEPRLVTAEDDEKMQGMCLIPPDFPSLNAYLKHLSS